MKKRVLLLARIVHATLACLAVPLWPLKGLLLRPFQGGERHHFWPCPLSADPPPTRRMELKTPDGKQLFFPTVGVCSLGHLQVNLVPLFLPEADVRQLLPDFLELAPQPVAPPGLHPVLMFLGHQHAVRPMPFRVSGMDYLEYILGVPYVRLTATDVHYRGPFAYMPRLFLDSAFAVLLGKLCGYAKQRSQIEATHNTYHVRNRSDNAPILSGMFQPLGDAFEPIPDSRSGNALRKLLEQPIIGDRLLGFTITTYLDFYLPWSKVQPAAAELTIHQAFLPGVVPHTYNVPALTHDTLGACRLASHWRLYPPLSVHDIMAEPPKRRHR
jgi:hypothetical protein